MEPDDLRQEIQASLEASAGDTGDFPMILPGQFRRNTARSSVLVWLDTTRSLKYER